MHSRGPSPAHGIAAPPVAAVSQILPRLRAQVAGFAGAGFGAVIAARRALVGVQTGPVRARVSFADVNGPKGGLDVRCAIDVKIPRTAPLHAEETAACDVTAFDLSEASISGRLRGSSNAGRRAGGTRRSTTPPDACSSVGRRGVGGVAPLRRCLALSTRETVSRALEQRLANKARRQAARDQDGARPGTEAARERRRIRAVPSAPWRRSRP
jgi:hypothetical protein